jgi:hypothetical protein
MVTNSKQPTIEELLETLNNPDLTRYHKSVAGSFARMLAYIDNISTSGVQPDIKLLIKTYREMAAKFYQQFEFSLLDEIKKQSDSHSMFEDTINKLSSLTESENKVLESFLTDTSTKAADEEGRLIENFPTQMQNVLDKLRQEWQRLNAVAAASKTLAKDTILMRALDLVVESAKISIGTTDRIAIVSGDVFSLQFYSYLKNFAVLTVPIYSVQAPWEWSIFWHELAGAKAHRLKNNTALEIDTTREKLKAFHEYFQKKKAKNEEQEVLEIIVRNNRYTNYAQSQDEDDRKLNERKNNFSQGYLNKAFSDVTPDLSDLGSMEHQFERMLANLPGGEYKFGIYEEVKKAGWCVDWLKELFEDAWSILAIREPFLDFFKDILSRHVAVDGVHPPMQVRLDVADELLRLMKSEYNPDDRLKSMKQIAAEQILKFISLLMVANYKIPPITDSDDSTSLSENEQTYMVPDVVGTKIGSYIQKRSAERDMETEDKDYDDFINLFSSTDAKEFVNKLIDSNKAEVSYKDMLGDKDYKRLLDLSFYDVDFGTASVTNVYFGINLKLPSANLNSLPDEVTDGLVKYNIGTETHHTSVDKWNAKAADGFKI